MKMKSILSGLIVVYAVCMFPAAGCSQASNESTEETPVAIANVRYIIEGVDAALGFYPKLAKLASFRYLIDDARSSVDFTQLGFTVDPSTGDVGTRITTGRARALVGVVVGLISLFIGGLAFARAAGRIGSGNGRTGAVVALMLGLIGMVLSVVHLGTSTGGFGTGSGRAGAIVALVLGLLGINLGGLALARSRRSGSTQ